MKDYSGIINFPHFHNSDKPYMSMHDRAAQFAPFKSLTGFEDQVSDKTDEILDDEWEAIDTSDSQEPPEES